MVISSFGILARQECKKKVAYLNTVVAGCYPAVLDLDVGWWMCEFTLSVRPGAFVPLKLPAYLQLQPSRIFSID